MLHGVSMPYPDRIYCWYSYILSRETHQTFRWQKNIQDVLLIDHILLPSESARCFCLASISSQYKFHGSQPKSSIQMARSSISGQTHDDFQAVFRFIRSIFQNLRIINISIAIYIYTHTYINIHIIIYQYTYKNLSEIIFP